MKRRREFARATMMVTHAIVIGMALLVVARLRFGAEWISVWDNLIPRSGVAAVGYVVLAVTVFSLSGLYRFDDRWSLRGAIGDITKAVAVLVLVTLALLFFFKLDQVSRRYLFGVFVSIWFGVIVSTIGVRQVFAWARSSGFAVRNVVIVGSGSEAALFVQGVVVEHPELGVKIKGFVGPPEAKLDSYERLGEVDDLPTILADNVIDEVAVCLALDQWSEIDSIVRISEQQGVPVRIPLPVMDYAVAHGRLDQMSGVPILTLVVGPDQFIQLAIKRLIDLVLAVAGIVLLSPLLFAVAMVILVTQGRPIIFSQQRAGLHGRPFHLLKFRTMVDGAEEQKASLEILNERSGPVFKVTNDPRVTRAGRFLRKSSIDELPQLWNVVVGEMSLVGPRPPTVTEVQDYDLRHQRRLSMKPGITGSWQVTARNDPSFERWVELDLQYIDTWSLMTDLSLLIRTPVALIRRPGQ